MVKHLRSCTLSISAVLVTTAGCQGPEPAETPGPENGARAQRAAAEVESLLDLGHEAVRPWAYGSSRPPPDSPGRLPHRGLRLPEPDAAATAAGATPATRHPWPR